MVVFKIKAIQQQKITITNHQYKLNKIKKQCFCTVFSLTINSIHRQVFNKNYQPLIRQFKKNKFQTQFTEKFSHFRDEQYYGKMQIENYDKKTKLQFKKQPIKIEKKYKIQEIFEKRQNKQPIPMNLNFLKDSYTSINQDKNSLKVEKKNVPSQNLQFFKRRQTILQFPNKNNQKQMQQQQQHKKKLCLQQKPPAKMQNEPEVIKPDGHFSSEQQSEGQIDHQQKLNEGQKQLGFPCVRGRSFIHRMKIEEQRKDVKYRIANYLIQGKSRFTPDVQQQLNLLYKEDVNNNLHLMVRKGLKMFRQYGKKHAKQKNLFTYSDDYKVILDIIRLMASFRCDSQQQFKQFRRILLIFYLNYANLNNKYTLTPDDMKNAYVLFRNVYKLMENQRKQKEKKKQKH